MPETPIANAPPSPVPPARPEPVRFWYRGRVQAVVATAPTRSLLEWLREDARCTGTKEGCNEGDCGACTVVVGELDPAAGDSAATLRLRTLNACTQFLPAMQGKALFTVESLAEPGLHPVQQALVDQHASQCGFCTPGFVMSMWALYESALQSGVRPDREQAADALSGNLCRCTGYRPILDACASMFERYPERPIDRAPVIQALQALADAPPATATGARWWAPRTLAELATLRAAHPQATLLAGGTDIGLWVTKQFREVGDLIHVADVAELRRIDERQEADGRWLCIGAGAPLEDAWKALAARWPALTEVWMRFASPPVRNAGTMGGNVANGSPIGDSAPILMALDARLRLRQGERVRHVALDAFYLGYMKNALQPGEFVEAIEVPLPPGSQVPPRRVDVRGWKISKRHDCDISAVCAGLRIERDAGDTIVAARLAFGGMAATVARAPGAEAALVGRPWTAETLAATTAALAADFTPLTDLRASSDYRRQVAARLLQRLWLETRAIDPLPALALRAAPMHGVVHVDPPATRLAPEVPR